MTHAGIPTLIPLGPSFDLPREYFSLRWWVVGSLLFHVLFGLLALTLRFSPSIERPLVAYEVSLVSLPGLESSAPSKASSAPSKPKVPPSPPHQSQKKSALQPPKEAKPLPPLPLAPPRERLSDSISGAVGSIVVPEKLASPSPSRTEGHTLQKPESKRLKETQAAIENLELPPKAPKLARAEPFTKRTTSNNLKVKPELPNRSTPKAVQADLRPATPLSVSTPPPQRRQPDVDSTTKEVLQGIKIPPKAPDLSYGKPFSKRREASVSIPSPKNLEQSLKETLQAVKVPVAPLSKPTKRPASGRKTPSSPKPSNNGLVIPESPQLARVAPSPKIRQEKPPTARRERLSDSLKKVLESVHVPQLQEMPEAAVQAPKSQKDPEKSLHSNKTLEALKTIRLPKRAEELPDPKSETLRPLPEHQKPTRLQNEIKKQMAKLTVPEVAPIESIRKRLKIQEVKTGASGDSHSTSNTGQGSGGGSQKSRYLALVQAKIDQKWVAPQVSVDKKNLQAVVTFRIDRRGEVSNLAITQSSGNDYYDSAAQRAVKAAEPLPTFPSEIRESILDVRYLFTLGESNK